MGALETRGSERQSVLMVAHVSFENSPERHVVRIRDLSAFGVRAEGDAAVHLGVRLEIDFGAAGKVMGTVAWCKGTGFGIVLDQEIQPEVVRRAAIEKGAEKYEAPRFLRGVGSAKESREPSRPV